MGSTEKDAIVISGLNIKDNNRGTAALGYGAISFLEQNENLDDKTELIGIRIYRKPFTARNRKTVDPELSQTVKNGSKSRRITVYNFFVLHDFLLRKFGITIPFSRFRKTLKRIKYVAEIYGGDGFSDIYGTEIFESRLPLTRIAMSAGIPVILLPQTVGPFKDEANRREAHNILKYAKRVYIRDDKYVNELNNLGVKYIADNDISAYMQSEPFEIDVPKDAIGLNISGLAYFNQFEKLSGQFDCYRELCEKIIEHFQSLGKTVFLISHSYNYNCPEPNNDDLQASRDFYKKLCNKEGVVLVDRDLTSPQTKYLISKMSFFIGTRMHANFAAIFTKVPLFGLAYSYKFQGAFEQNGIYGQTAKINNITSEDIPLIINQIANVYNKTVNK